MGDDSFSDTSNTLLSQIRSRDPAAWQRFSSIYGPIIFAWARRAGLDEHEACDAMQDVFKAVFVSIDHFRKARPEDRFRDWLWTITRRRSIDRLRKKGKTPVAVGGSDARLQFQIIPEDLEEDSENEPGFAAQVMARTLELLKPEFRDKTWKAFVGTAIENKTGEEVANELNMSIGAVYVARSRVMKRIRKELEGLL